MEPAAAREETVGDECMQMWMKTEVFAEGMNGHDCAGNAVGQLQDFALVVFLFFYGVLKRLAHEQRTPIP